MATPAPLRHAIITGGSRGIGLAIAQLFAQHSYRLTLLSRSPQVLTFALSTLESSHLPPHHAHQYFAGDISSSAFWHQDNLALDGKIDVVVNCAGITQNSLLVRTDPDDIQKIMDTNLTGMMLGTRYLLRKRYIRAADETFSPVIINIASLLGLKGGRGAVAYAASKAGVLGFTRALAEEVGRTGVRVNAIVPGYITTDMTTEMEASRDLLSKIPAGRFGRPEEVADAALFLTKNQYANNCVLNLDGGLSAT